MAIVTTVTGAEALADAAAERITALIEASMDARGATTLCLTGGQTPEHLYRLLADPTRPWRARIDWGRLHLYWGDERAVPPDAPESNYGMAARTLLDHVPIPPTQVHRIRGEWLAAAAARAYAQTLPPVLDVMLLGIGTDAHIASIFPASPLLTPPGLHPGEGPVAAVWVPHLQAWRITLTPTALLSARAIVVMAAGAHKRDAVRAALDGEEDVTRHPAQLLRQAGDRVVWLLDADVLGEG